MKIEFIKYPYVYTDNGMRYHIDDQLIGKPRVGAELALGGGGKVHVLAITNDNECVNGVCPVK